MLFRIFISLLFLLSLKTSFSQNQLTNDRIVKESTLVAPANVERYNIDFRVVEWAEIDKETIELINLKELENARAENEDLQFYIAELNITVELFSIVKTLDNAEKSKLKISYFHDKYFTIISE